MDQVEVRMNEWVLTQGMVGYKRILEYSGIDVPTNEQGIVVTKEALQQLPRAYFDYFLNKHSYVERNSKILMARHSKWKKGNSSSKRELNAQLKDIRDRVKRYFKEHPAGKVLLEYIDKYRKEKTYQAEMDDWLQTIIEAMRTKEIDEKLTSNIFKAIQLKEFYGQVSFLNVSKNKLSIEEQISLLREDFVQPVFDEWNFMKFLRDDDEANLHELLNHTNHKGLKSLRRPLKKKTIQEISSHLTDEVLKCSLTDFSLGLYNLEEGVFAPLALSMNNALNMTWNSEGKCQFPISALSRLILFCAAAGSTRTYQNNVFVYYDGMFDEIYQSNEHYDIEAGREKSFDEIIFSLVKEYQIKTNWLAQSYMVFEYQSDYDSKRTLLDYMIMTPNLIKLFQNHGHLLNNVHYTHRSGFIKLLLKNIDTKQFISKVLRENLKKGYSSLEVIFMTILRHYNQFYLKEVEEQMNAEQQQKYVWVLYKSAEQVRTAIGLKKAQGIAYRLLNAVQAGNKNTFMDTVMRVYISSELEMPTLLLEALHEHKIDFETVANAWIAGLISKPNEKGEVSHD